MTKPSAAHAAAFLVMTLAAAAPAGAALEWAVFTDPSEIRAIAPAPEAVWAAGRGGLVRLDRASGQTEVFTTEDGFPTNDLSAVLAASTGEIWVGTRGEGLLRYRSAEALPWFRYQTFPQGLASDLIRCLLEDGAGKVWYGTDEGFGVIENETPTRIWTSDHGLANTDVYCLAAAGDTLYAGTGAGIYRLPGDAAPEAEGAGAPGGQIAALALGAGRLWAVSGGLLWSRPREGGAWASTASPVAGFLMSALAAGGDSLVVALDEPASPNNRDRVFSYRPEGAVWTDLSAGLPNDYYYPAYNALDYTALALDAGGIWLGGSVTDGIGTGLLHYSAGAWEHHPFADQPLGAEFKVLCAGHGEGFWGLSIIGAARYDGATWTRVFSSAAMSGWPRNSLDMLEDSQGWVWFNRFTYGFGRMRLSDGFVEMIQTAPAAYKRMAEDADGNRWFLSTDGSRPLNDVYVAARGIDVCTADETWYNLSTVSAGLPGDNLDDYAWLPDGRIALLFRGIGLEVWDHAGTLTDPADDQWWAVGSGIADDDELLSSDTQFGSVAAGPDGSLWLGQASGLVYLRPQGSGWIAEDLLGPKSLLEDGLPGSDVTDVVAAPDSGVWVGTTLGLSRVHFAPGTRAWTVQTWTSEAGWEALGGTSLYPRSVISPLPNADVRRLALDPDGRSLWVGTREGLARVRELPDAEPPADQLARAYLYPNPAQAALGHAAVRLGGVDGPVRVKVYNLEGQLVADPGAVAPGEVLWDLQTRYGSRAVAGVYFLRLEDRGRVTTRTLTVLR